MFYKRFMSILFIVLLVFFSNMNINLSNKEQVSVAASDNTDISAIDKIVEEYIQSGDITSESTIKSLKLHLEVLKYYEDNVLTGNLLKHLGGLIVLIDKNYQSNNISESAYKVLKEAMKSVIEENQLDFDAGQAIEHIRYLSEEIGPRVGGTEQEAEAAEYIIKEFESLGYPVTIDKFNIEESRYEKLELIDKNIEIPLRSATFSETTIEEGITSELYYANYGQADDFTEDIKDKIVIIKRGKTSFRTATHLAAEAGALGLIVIDNTDNLRAFRPGTSNEPVPIPLAGITAEDGEKILEYMENETLEVKFIVQNLYNQESQNIIATKKPTHSSGNDEIVYVTAHYDSVPFSPGANDDASGVGLILEIARVLKDFPTNKEIRFIAFGHEESGQSGSRIGSRHYVSNLSDDEINKSRADFQFDMVATSWEEATRLNVNIVDGKANTVWDFAELAGDKLEYDNVTLFKKGSSDHESFFDVGIDSANISWRQPETGGLEPYYHTPHDTMEHISESRLQKLGDLANIAISQLLIE